MPAGPRGVRVVVVRHGPAEIRDPARWPDDSRRPLTSKGIVQCRRGSRALARFAKGAKRIATSEAQRSLETAEIVRSAFRPPPRLERWPELASGNLAQPIFERVRRTARPRELLFLVGHEPTLNEFLGLALTGESVSAVRLTKGGAACVEFDASVRPAGGQLLWLFTRKQLADVRG
jgi:phosphohistidine phosphatase